MKIWIYNICQNVGIEIQNLDSCTLCWSLERNVLPWEPKNPILRLLHKHISVSILLYTLPRGNQSLLQVDIYNKHYCPHSLLVFHCILFVEQLVLTKGNPWCLNPSPQQFSADTIVSQFWFIKLIRNDDLIIDNIYICVSFFLLKCILLPLDDRSFSY